MSRVVALRHWRLLRSGTSPNPQGLAQRARAFTAAVAECRQASLLTVREGPSMSSWVTVPASGSADTAAMQLAHAVGARADESAVGPSLDAPVVGRLVAVQSSATRDTQHGVDPGEVARRLAVAMRSGSWVGVSLRAPSRGEVRNSHRWYEHRLGTTMPTHHAFDDGAVVASIFAGGSSSSEVKALLSQVASVLPGFDIGTKAKVASAVRAVAAWVAVAVVAAVAVGVVTGNVWLANLAAAPAVAIALLYATGRLSSKASRLVASVRSGLLPRPAKRRVPAAKPRAENPTVAGRKGRATDGGYPLAEDSFLVGPVVPIGVVAPHAGAASGATSTNSRAVPEPLTNRIGPMLGQVVGGPEQIHLPAADGFAGTALVGSPGSGKSAALRGIWGWHCLERAAPAGEPGWPGDRNAMIAFESKGDDADAYRLWAEGSGDRTLIVDVADPSSFRIDLFAVGGSAAERAGWFTNAMVYAFGEGAIQDRSFETLKAVLTAGLAANAEVFAAAGLDPDTSPMAAAHVLLGGAGDQRGKRLATAIAERASFAEREAQSHALGDGSQSASAAVTDLGQAAEALAPLYGSDGSKVTDSQRRNLTEAPRNKVAQLLAADSWWGDGRRKITWEQVLSKHRSVVVNTGITRNGQLVEERLTQQMSALMMFSLKAAIQRHCSGWRAEGRSVTVFVDELALVAGSGPEVITWLRNQGRSYGVRPVFATQYPEQLNRDVRTAFMSFSTLVAFSQQNSDVAASIAEDLSLGDEEWTGSDLKSMEPFHAAIRTSVAQHRQPTVAVKVPFFEDGLAVDTDRTVSEFRSGQGL